MKLNKKRIGFVLGVLVLFLLIISFTMKKSSATEELTKIKDKTIEGINIENAKIEKEHDGYRFMVDLYNESVDKVEINSLTVIFKKDDNDIKIKIDDISSLESFEGRKLEIKIDEDLENVNGIEYKIDKK